MYPVCLGVRALLACPWAAVGSWECAGMLADSKTPLYLRPCLGCKWAQERERDEALVVPFVRLKSSLQTTLLLSQYLEARRRCVFRLFGD